MKKVSASKLTQSDKVGLDKRAINALRFGVIILIIALISCCGNKTAKVKDDIPVINLSQKYPSKTFSIQELADIKYVPLETTDDVLIDKVAKIVYVSDTRIIIVNLSLGDVFVFDGDGKILSHFNRKGGGSDEYIYPEQVVYDEKAKEIFVYESYKRKLLVFTETGEIKRTLQTTDNTRFSLYNFDDETLFAYDEYGTEGGSDREYRRKPYLFLSKQDGGIVVELDRVLPVRYSDRVIFTVKDKSGKDVRATKVISFMNNWYDGKDFVIADLSSDTIFQMTQDKQLSPLIIRTPSVHDNNIKTFLSPIIKNDLFIYLLHITIDFDDFDAGSERTLLYSFADKTIYEASFSSSDLPTEIEFNQLTSNVDVGKNMAVSLINSHKIVEYLDEGKIEGTLLPIAQKLSADDNPVLVIMKFR
jgi:hypothetical protein